jgi:hypothetical protein
MKEASAGPRVTTPCRSSCPVGTEEASAYAARARCTATTWLSSTRPEQTQIGPTSTTTRQACSRTSGTTRDQVPNCTQRGPAVTSFCASHSKSSTRRAVTDRAFLRSSCSGKQRRGADGMWSSSAWRSLGQRTLTRLRNIGPPTGHPRQIALSREFSGPTKAAPRPLNHAPPPLASGAATEAEGRRRGGSETHAPDRRRPPAIGTSAGGRLSERQHHVSGDRRFSTGPPRQCRVGWKAAVTASLPVFHTGSSPSWLPGDGR